MLLLLIQGVLAPDPYAVPDGTLILTAAIVVAGLFFLWALTNPPSTRRHK